MDGNTFRILVATDNHLGYNEKDPITGNDSFDAFEEILRYARDLSVDMLLLGGDLFHENKPSRRTLHAAFELFRHYCLGDKECPVEFLSDPSVNFHSKFANVNYQDPNYNVAIPVFAIHGNHDDPAGDGALSALDLLSTAGLINYFGRQREVDDITASPIILKKGTSHLSLYGIGNIRDERLYRTFTAKKVKFLRPIAQQESPGDWFNLLLFHQNRAAHGPTNHIPEVFLDDFLDLIIWGHEHDCQIDPVYVPQRDFYVCQPGSSTITSLSEGESKRKHVALLTVKGSQFELGPLPLKSSRPFKFADLILQQCEGLAVNDSKGITSVITGKVERMIEEAKRDWTAENVNTPFPLPLIRLRVDYSGGFQAINPQRFGQAFSDRVANPRDIILLIRKRQMSSKPSSVRINIPENDSHVDKSAVRVEEMVTDFLGAQRLDLLPHNEFSDIVKIFVEKDDKDAIDSFLKASLNRTIDALKVKSSLESLRDEIGRVRLSREEEWRRLNPTGEALINYRVSRPQVDDDSTQSEGDEENRPQMTVESRGPQSATTGRGRGRGRASRGRLQLTRTTTADDGNGFSSNATEISESYQKSNPETPIKKSRWTKK